MTPMGEFRCPGRRDVGSGRSRLEAASVVILRIVLSFLEISGKLRGLSVFSY